MMCITERAPLTYKLRVRLRPILRQLASYAASEPYVARPGRQPTAEVPAMKTRLLYR